MKVYGFALLAALLGVSLLTMSPDAWAQKTKGKTRAASTKQLMKGVVAANCGDLKKALDAETTDWEVVALKAALLNEAGYFLMDDGRCPDGEWAKGAKTLQECSAVVLAKAEAKDLDGAKAAFAALTAGSCAVCHKAHKM